MDYVFSAIGSHEVVRTKGIDHASLSGYQVIERKTSNQIITDSFFVTKQIDERTDADGYIYKWYEIDKHYRMSDKYTPDKDRIDNGISDTQDAICTLTEDIDLRMADIEDAICALTEEV